VPEVESYPGPLLTQWTVGVENENATGTVFRFDSICDDRDLSYGASDDTVVSQTQGSDSRTCGASEHVISGGQKNAGAAQGDIVVAATRPSNFASNSPDIWQVWLDNHHTSTLAFTTYAICTPDVNAN